MPRFFAVGYAILLLTAGLFPFQGWRDSGVPVWAFLGYHWPYYFSRFDFGINIAAFLPLGMACRQEARRSWGPFGAWLITVLLCSSFSFCIETIQVFLPNRNASNVDLLANSLGGVLGALLPPVFRRLPFALAFRRWRYHVFAEGMLADYGLALAVIWFVAQCNPALPMFGIVVQPHGLPQPFESPIPDPALFLRLLEVGGALLHFWGVAIFLATLLKSHRYFLKAIVSLSGMTLLIKLFLAGILLTPSFFFSWLNLNIVLAQCIGWLLLPAILRLRRRYLAGIAILMLLAEQLISYYWPLTANPVAMLHLFRWSLGHLQNFNAVADLAADIWPVSAVLYFVLFIYQRWRDV